MQIAMLQAFLPSTSRGGVGYQVAGLATALTRRGHRVTVFSFSPASPGDCFEVTSPAGGSSILQGKAARLLLAPIAFAGRSYSEFDVVHAHGDNQFLWRRSVPIVRTFHGSAMDEAAHATRLRRKIAQRGLVPFEHVARRVATCTVGVSQNTAESVGPLDSIIPCGVDRELFRPGPKSQEPSILFVGTLGGRKRGRLIVEVFRQVIQPALPSAELWLVADETAVGEGIRNISSPSETDLAALYRRAWVLVHPSSYEGFGVPYIEAMASGTAIVSTPNAGAVELLGQGGAGLVVPVEAMSAAILQVLSDSAARTSMERAGREQSRVYHWEGVAGRYEDVYASAVKKVETARARCRPA